MFGTEAFGLIEVDDTRCVAIEFYDFCGGHDRIVAGGNVAFSRYVSRKE